MNEIEKLKNKIRTLNYDIDCLESDIYYYNYNHNLDDKYFKKYAKTLNIINEVVNNNKPIPRSWLFIEIIKSLNIELETLKTELKTLNSELEILVQNSEPLTFGQAKQMFEELFEKLYTKLSKDISM